MAKYNHAYNSILLNKNNKCIDEKLCYDLDTHSWFDTKIHINKKKYKSHSFENESEHFDTLKIELKLTKKQKDIIFPQFRAIIDIYNKANAHIKKICTKNNVKKIGQFKKFCNYYKIRKDIKEFIHDKCSETNNYIHTGNYAVEKLVNNYKSAFGNLEFYNKVEMNNWHYCKQRKFMTYEPGNLKLNINKNKKVKSLYIKMLDMTLECVNDISVESEEIKHNCDFSYDNYEKKFYLHLPKKIETVKKGCRYKKCGIDGGCRTFMTVYSPEKTYEMVTSEVSYPKMKNYFKKVDNLQSRHDKKEIGNKKYSKAREKYERRMRNKIKDMHSKVANKLCRNYDEINIGKMNVQKMIEKKKENKNKELPDIVKRRLVVLSHYTFIGRLKNIAKKYGTKVSVVSEYMTTKTCHNCRTKKEMGILKIYECKKCKIKIDRDINSAINIYLK